jgi:formate hydrogenlyase subunit 6/NADH:ubiquinone oxidoreductase subunit I
MERVRKKAVVLQSQCVACGCCKKVCPMQAISIPHGLFAVVDENKCVGCAKCARECPASVIQMEVRS